MKNLKIIFLSFLLSLNLNAFDEFLVSDIRIIGLQRVSTGSIFNVIPISVGDRIDIGSPMILLDLFFQLNNLMTFKSVKMEILLSLL